MYKKCAPKFIQFTQHTHTQREREREKAATNTH